MMHEDDRLRSNIFYMVLGLTLLVLIISGQIAAQQKQVAYQQYVNFFEAQQLIRSGRYNDAAILLKDLVKSNHNSYKVLWYYGVCLAKQGRFKEANYYLDEAANEYPRLYLIQSYLLTRGTVYVHLAEKKKAKKFLEASLKYGDTELLKKEAQKYLKNLR